MDVTMMAIYVVWVLSGLFSFIVAAGILTYVRRTWQLIRSDSDGSARSEVLDALDQMQLQLYSMSERMERMEGRLGAGDETPPALPEAEADPDPETDGDER